MSGLLSSSIARKVAMALSALFLIIFLIIHVAVNITSIFSEEVFNDLSHFMGTNPLIQFGMQPILILGVVFHFVMGFVLEIQNRIARGGQKYAKFNGAAGATWMSRNMVYSGAAILAFLILHFLDFWIPEINTKYIIGDMSGMIDGEEGYRYFHELQHKFVPLWRTAAYVIAFVFLGLHLAHGFQSAFQSIGFNNKFSKGLKTFGNAYAIIIPLCFIIVALFHHFNH